MGETPPVRIQLRRTKGWRLPPGAIVVARPSRWGNPYVVGSDSVRYSGAMLGPVGCYNPNDVRYCDISIGTLSAARAVALYRDDLTASLADTGVDYDELRQALRSLAGHDLACWCPLTHPDGSPHPCHADVLLELANENWSTPRHSGAERQP